MKSSAKCSFPKVPVHSLSLQFQAGHWLHGGCCWGGGRVKNEANSKALRGRWTETIFFSSTIDTNGMLAQLGLVCEMRTFRNEIKRDSKSDQIDWYSSKIWKLFFTCFHLQFWGSSSWWCRWARSICPCRRGLGLGGRSLLLPEQSLGLEHSSILRDPGSSCERDSKASMEIPFALSCPNFADLRVESNTTQWAFAQKYARSKIADCDELREAAPLCFQQSVLSSYKTHGLEAHAWTWCQGFAETKLDVIATEMHLLIVNNPETWASSHHMYIYVKVQYFPSSQSHSACDACSDCTSEDTSPKNHLSKKAALAWCLVLPCVLLSASLRAVYGNFAKVYTFRFSKPGIFQNFTRTWLSDVRS